MAAMSRPPKTWCGRITSLAKHLNEPDYPYGNKWFIDKLPPDDSPAGGNRGLSSDKSNLLTLALAG
jgi:hypothetical protein